MTNVSKVLSLRRASGESVVSFRGKVECVMAQGGYVRGEDCEEQRGKVKVHTYSGVDGQFLVYKFVIFPRRGMLKCDILPALKVRPSVESPSASGASITCSTNQSAKQSYDDYPDFSHIRSPPRR